jgi:hypothetical protein
MLNPPPPFPVPLNDEQLQELGLFCVVWSQIDMLITMLLTNLSGAPSVDVIAMTASATTAPRLAMLERIVGRIRKDEAIANPYPSEVAKARDATLKQIADTCKKLHGLAERRNHLMHGFWGHFHPPRGGETVGSHYDRYRDNPIMVGTLSRLTDKGARLGSQLHHAQLQLEQIRQGLSP